MYSLGQWNYQEGRKGLLCIAEKNKKVAFLFQGKVGEAAKVL